jgi:hypothetical protein
MSFTSLREVFVLFLLQIQHEQGAAMFNVHLLCMCTAETAL